MVSSVKSQRWENTGGMIFGGDGRYRLGVMHVFTSPLTFARTMRDVS